MGPELARAGQSRPDWRAYVRNIEKKREIARLTPSANMRRRQLREGGHSVSDCDGCTTELRGRNL